MLICTLSLIVVIIIVRYFECKLKAATPSATSTAAPKATEEEVVVYTKKPLSTATKTSTARALTASAVVGWVDAAVNTVEGMLAAALAQTKASGPADDATIDSLVALIVSDSDAATKAMVDAIEREADPAVSGALYDQIKQALASTDSSAQAFEEFFQQADAAVAAKSAEPGDAEGAAPKSYGGAIAGAIVAVIVAVIVAYAVMKHSEKQDVIVAATIRRMSVSTPPVYQNPAYSSSSGGGGGAAPDNGVGRLGPGNRMILEDSSNDVGGGAAPMSVDYRNPAEFVASARNGLERGNSMC